MKEIAADVAGVIDALSPEAPAVLMGHDWGAPIVWHTAVFHPEQVRAVAGLSVPYGGLPPMSLDALIKAGFTDQGKFFYQAYFKDEDVAEAAFEADVRAGLRKLYFTGSGDSQGYWGGPDKKAGDALLDGLENPEPFPSWLSAADIDYYVSEFEGSGFRGPLNRYRNHTRDWEYMNTVADRIVHQPSLFIVGENDLVLRMFGGSMETALERMRPHVADLRAAHLIPKIGHWTQQEAPEQATRLLIDWLATL